MDQLHAKISKSVKSQLPRRESERRNHPLARHVDILSAVETRLSLLGMSYLKYIDMGLCCFIPGKVRSELLKTNCIYASINHDIFCDDTVHVLILMASIDSS